MCGRAAAAAALGGLVALVGCGPNVNPPPNFLPTVLEAQADVHGAWMRVQVDQYTDLEGELIAVQSDSLHLLVDDGVLRSVRIGEASRTTVVVHSTNSGEFAAWTLLGTLSTASHGAYLVFTAPMWMIFGTVASTNAAREGADDYWVHPPGSTALQPFARFPAGFPSGLDRSSLQMKVGRGTDVGE